jgi:uroporphyrinogen-III synthase
MADHRDGAAPLERCRVVVVRADDGTSHLADQLAAAGAEVVVVPLVEIVDRAGPADIDAALSGLGAADWVVVTSARGATRVAGALVASPSVRVAAVGASTAAELPRVDLVPERQSAAGLVEVFPACPGAGRVVVVQAVGGAPTMVEGVRALGWQVERLDTHESTPRALSGREQLEVLRADAVAFTSGSQARAWAAVLGSATPPVVVAIGPQTAGDVDAAGLSVTAVATKHSVEGLIDTLVATLRAE